jgi:hypothetical protein
MKIKIAIIAVSFSVVSLGMDGEQGAGPVRNGHLNNREQRGVERAAAPYPRCNLFGATKQCPDRLRQLQIENEREPGPTFEADLGDLEKMESSSDEDIDFGAFSRSALAGPGAARSFDDQQYYDSLRSVVESSNFSSVSFYSNSNPISGPQENAQVDQYEEERDELNEDQIIPDVP